jgi:hypothetical protein
VSRGGGIDRPSTRLEIWVGRALAVCAHPYAAWRTGSTSRRLLIVLGYAGIAYLAVLGALLR